MCDICHRGPAKIYWPGQRPDQIRLRKAFELVSSNGKITIKQAADILHKKKYKYTTASIKSALKRGSIVPKLKGKSVSINDSISLEHIVMWATNPDLHKPGPKVDMRKRFEKERAESIKKYGF